MLYAPRFGSVHTMTTRALPEQRATEGEPLLLTLAGVAELAQVSRPVASMWRTRFASTADPFPASLARLNGADAFDASEVADWLTRTAHGNNPDAKMDAAAAAVPADFSFSDPQAVVILGLVFLKYVSDAFDERRAGIRAELSADGYDDEQIADLIDDTDEYTGGGVFWVPTIARWGFLAEHAKGLGPSMDGPEKSIGC